ncbi:MAG: TIR domain-containing protein [Eubacterium sp.]|nr:TIR domain-containing protein [Eubacterium sp.]
MEYVDGITLREYLLKQPDGYIPWVDTKYLFTQVFLAIEYIHNKNYIHGAINPDHIILLSNGTVKLVPISIFNLKDFGKFSQLSIEDGYSAIEQYKYNDFWLDTETDIYSICACIYRSLVGQNPPDAQAREINDKLIMPNSIVETLPINVLRALGGGLQVYPLKRIKDVRTLEQILMSSIESTTQKTHFLKKYKLKKDINANKNAKYKNTNKNDNAIEKFNDDKTPLKKNSYAFISYSSKNQNMADSTRHLMKTEGIPCWMAPYDIPAGSKYAFVINDALKNCACLVLLLTKESQNSEFVEKEVERAITYRKPIVTIQLENIKLNSGFEFYIGNQQIVAVKEINANDSDMRRALNGISALVGDK